MYGGLKIFAGRSHPELARRICEHLDSPLGASDVVRFSNDNLKVRIDENVRGCDVFVLQTAAPPVNDHLVELLIYIDALRHASASRITAVLPHMPYTRSDKKDEPRISITARLMADLLESAGADRVLTMDLHAPQIQGFFRIPVDHLLAEPILADYLREHGTDDTVLVSGDVGGAKDVGRFASRLHLPMAVIDKRRVDDNEKPYPTHVIGDVDGKQAIIVDDEVATGGTLVSAAGFLREHGARRVSAAFTHPILAGDAVSKLDASPLDELVFTDTLPLQGKHSDKFRLLSVSQLFAQAIRRIHDGNSVSSLFR